MSSAPQALQPIESFINTVNLGRVDPLTGPDELADWCVASGLCPNAGPADLDHLRAFREALRRLLEANAGAVDPQDAWSAMEPFVREVSYRMRVQAAGSPALEPTGEGAGRAIAALLA